MEFFVDVFNWMYGKLGNQLWLVAIVVLFIGVVAQWRLYDKAKQPGVASIVPIWNLIAFLKIVGRPAWHSLFIVIPSLVMLGIMMIDHVNLFAFMGDGLKGFENVSVTFPIFAAAAIFFSLFMIKIYIELCDSFGKSTVLDYFLVVILNILYILNLSLSYDTVYHGPVYGKRGSVKGTAAHQLA